MLWLSGWCKLQYYYVHSSRLTVTDNYFCVGDVVASPFDLKQKQNVKWLQIIVNSISKCVVSMIAFYCLVFTKWYWEKHCTFIVKYLYRCRHHSMSLYSHKSHIIIIFSLLIKILFLTYLNTYYCHAVPKHIFLKTLCSKVNYCIQFLILYSLKIIDIFKLT